MEAFDWAFHHTVSLDLFAYMNACQAARQFHSLSPQSSYQLYLILKVFKVSLMEMYEKMKGHRKKINDKNK